MHMEKILFINGHEVDVDRRPTAARNDIDRHTALLQRDIAALIKRDEQRFRSICESRGVVGKTLEELQSNFLALFRGEKHYKKRNKLRAEVTKKL